MCLPEVYDKTAEICHTQLVTVTVCVIWLVGFSVEVVLPSLVQRAGEASLFRFLVLILRYSISSVNYSIPNAQPGGRVNFPALGRKGAAAD